MAEREGLQSLLEQGIIDAVLRPLMSGKEAQVFLVEVGGELRVAKIYKEAAHRSFKHRAIYTEGRQARRSRDQRAMKKGSRYGKEQTEAAWRSAEVDAIYRLRAADVRVPEPFDYYDGVLVMELVQGEDGSTCVYTTLAVADTEEQRFVRIISPTVAERCFPKWLEEFGITVDKETGKWDRSKCRSQNPPRRSIPG